MNDIIAKLALDLPAHPTSADILRALVRAEQAGYDRAVYKILLNQAPLITTMLPGILKRQAS